MAVPRRAGIMGLAAGLLAIAPLALGWAQSPAEAGERVVDRVVAVIEGQVLTRSELEFEARVALAQRGGAQALEVPLGDAALKAALELTIYQRMQVLNADRLQAFPAEPGEVEARLEALQARVGGEAVLRRFLARYDMRLEDLKAVLTRGVRSERILDSRIRLRAQVGETDVRDYFDRHVSDYPAGYEASRAAIREMLVREKYVGLAAKELAAIRESAQVRRVAPFAREARR